MVIWVGGEKDIKCWSFAHLNGNSILKSYHFISNVPNQEFFMLTENHPEIKLFLDSGAFSAFSQGAVINLHEYIEFIKKYEDKLEVYANLDAIGDPVQTFRNQNIMESAGLHPLPTFHYGEDTKWLRRYLDKGYDYIALGGMVPISNQDLLPWLDNLFLNYLTDKTTGLPTIKVHGFGMTSFMLMLRYPWYSVDSTSWIITGRTGGVYVPAFRDGVYSYREPPFKVTVSNRSPNSAVDPDHVECMPKLVRNTVLAYFEQKGYTLGKSEWFEKPVGYEPQENEKWLEKKAVREKAGKGKLERVIEYGLSNDYRKRDELNIIYFADLEKNMPQWPWPFKLKKRGFGVG